MSIVENLTAARALIDQPQKWVKGKYQIVLADGSTCFCALGALQTACLENAESSYDYYYELEALGAHIPHYYRVGVPDVSISNSLTRFNDSPDTTHAEVLMLFDKAISQGARED